MSLNASWAPQESHSAIVGEKLVLEGSFLVTVAYGVLLCLYVQVLSLIFSEQHKNKITLIRFIYATLLFACGTIGVAGDIKVTELTYIDNRNYPGGPVAFGNDVWLPVANMSFIVFQIAIWLQDGYLLYRFLVIWQYNWWLFILPCLVYLGTLTTSLIILYMVCNQGSNLWAEDAMKFFTAFWSLTIGLNVILTALIAGRLFYLRSKIREVLGEYHSRMYTSISAILIESAALYTSFALVYVVMYARQSNYQNIVAPPLTMIECIAPMLITYRVSRGLSLTPETMQLSTGIASSGSNSREIPVSPHSVEDQSIRSVRSSHTEPSKAFSEKMLIPPNHRWSHPPGLPFPSGAVVGASADALV